MSCRYFDKSCFVFGLTDYSVCLWVFEWDDRSVECGVFYFCWNDEDIPHYVCVVAVSCEYFLSVFENLEFIFAEQVEADVVPELSNG